MITQTNSFCVPSGCQKDDTTSDELMRKIQLSFKQRVQPIALLQVLGAKRKSILTDHDEEQVKSKDKNGPRSETCILLLNLLVKKKNWFKHLLESLEDRNVGLPDLADKYRKVYEDLRNKSSDTDGNAQTKQQEEMIQQKYRCSPFAVSSTSMQVTYGVADGPMIVSDNFGKGIVKQSPRVQKVHNSRHVPPRLLKDGDTFDGQLKRRISIDFKGRVDPLPLMDVLNARTTAILTEQDVETVSSKHTKASRCDACTLLLDLLAMKKNWFKHLLESLEHGSIGLSDLADTFRQCEEDLRNESPSDTDGHEETKHVVIIHSKHGVPSSHVSSTSMQSTDVTDGPTKDPDQFSKGIVKPSTKTGNALKDKWQYTQDGRQQVGAITQAEQPRRTNPVPVSTSRNIHAPSRHLTTSPDNFIQYIDCTSGKQYENYNVLEAKKGDESSNPVRVDVNSATPGKPATCLESHDISNLLNSDTSSNDSRPRPNVDECRPHDIQHNSYELNEVHGLPYDKQTKSKRMRPIYLPDVEHGRHDDQVTLEKQTVKPTQQVVPARVIELTQSEHEELESHPGFIPDRTQTGVNVRFRDKLPFDGIYALWFNEESQTLQLTITFNRKIRHFEIKKRTGHNGQQFYINEMNKNASLKDLISYHVSSGVQDMCEASKSYGMNIKLHQTLV